MSLCAYVLLLCVLQHVATATSFPSNVTQHGGFYGIDPGSECLLDTRRTRASNRLQLTGDMFGHDGPNGFVSAFFTGTSTKWMSESRAEVTVVFGEMNNGTSSPLLEHTQQLFVPSDVVTAVKYPPKAKDKSLRDALNVYINFRSLLLAANHIKLLPGVFYFLELSFDRHYREESHRCHRLDAVYTPTERPNERQAHYNVVHFGAVGDGQTDDTAAIQGAIYAAATVGGTVHIPPGRYSTTASILVPAGVTMEGAGLGENPRDMTGVKGSVVMYRGEEYAVVLQGDLIEVKNLVVYDNGEGGGTAAGGVLLDASQGQYLESLSLKRVLIFRFTAGTGLMLHAGNGGAVTYSSFYDVRVRNAKVGIHLLSTGTGGAFVNSNSFYKGVISGGGFDYGFLVEGPGANNNHNIDGLVIEPYTSTFGHMHVTGASSHVNAVNIRIEAAQQPDTTPMIHFGPETYSSKVSGLFSAGWIDANRMAHQLDMLTGKYVGASFSHYNLFGNSAFRGVPKTAASYEASAIPDWTLITLPNAESTLPTVTVSNSRQIIAGNNVLRLTLHPGTKVTMKSDTLTSSGGDSLYLSASFGQYVRYVNISQVESSSVYATFDTSASAVTTSLVHPGADTDWLFLSMTGSIPSSSGAGVAVDIYPRFVFHNTHPTDMLELEVTLPSFTFGAEPPQIESGPVLSSGGQMYGTLSTSLVKNIEIPSASSYYVLPKDGNVFLFKALDAGGSYPTISRLNHLTEDRFPQGTVITLLFLVESVSISKSAYIVLKSGFTSNSHCSLVLLSMGDGTWVEVSRDL